jgi:hypothetical protein
VVLSPQSTNASAECITFFGFIQDGSTAPPEGSGEITIYDYAQNEYTARYNSSNFTVAIQGCTYNFTAGMNEMSGQGMYKLQQHESSGVNCPKNTTCFDRYWATTNAMGVFTFLDVSEDRACPAFFALANPGSTEASGSFAIAGMAVGNWTSWVPPGYSGKYGSTGDESVAVWISTPECSFEFRLDPLSTEAGHSNDIDFPSTSPPPTAGAAIVDFYGASQDMCPTACMQDGYNIVWDATGKTPPPDPSHIYLTTNSRSNHLVGRHCLPLRPTPRTRRPDRHVAAHGVRGLRPLLRPRH